ncbi:MAG: hypothetical protein KFB96_10790 [Thiocapsa sp.]|uniref:hypothetical protein n=1 Tax=Thiocapsa sp. TaxID=2024551 RepID=UPI001BCBA709|nr:hypothetical protein [Thiocapsa sp.]QVL50840.1 MAG: hypothetical protein KFB96_10790 [Thiocapsa sp.]
MSMLQRVGASWHRLGNRLHKTFLRFARSKAQSRRQQRWSMMKRFIADTAR